MFMIKYCVFVVLYLKSNDIKISFIIVVKVRNCIIENEEIFNINF